MNDRALTILENNLLDAEIRLRDAQYAYLRSQEELLAASEEVRARRAYEATRSRRPHA